MAQDGFARIVLAHLFVATSVGIISAAAAMHFRQRNKSSNNKPTKEVHHHHLHTFAPSFNRTESGRFGNIEKFSDYVGNDSDLVDCPHCSYPFDFGNPTLKVNLCKVLLTHHTRQIGFKDGSECPKMTKLTNEYLKRTKGCDGKIYEYFANEKDAETLYVKLIEEFERCILSYFAFHWNQASLMISQALNVDSEQKKLKEFVMAATRKQRFEKITKELKVTRVFSTLVSEMKAIRTATNGESKCTEVMVPVAHNKRSPVLLLMGGGMGAGKSTVLKDIMAEPFWSEASTSANAVVVEADAFKETDVIYRALSSRGHHQDMLQTAELVHQSSTDAASSLLVTALNEGRDVIMDGTLSWEPFVEQTVAMARNVHKHRYRMGEGYKVAEDGTVTENYWEQIQEGEEDPVGDNEAADKSTKPYRIELVGVVCDAYLAVVRGIRRAVQTGRAVRVKPQLKSHKRFANAFPKYCHLVDNARLYCTNGIGTPPKLIAWKGGDSNLLVDAEEIKCLKEVSSLNDEAECIYELHDNQESDLIFKPGSVWNDFVLAPTVPGLRIELKNAISKIEVPVI